ncbi:hypothetical protein ACOHYD_10760 [Desulfobacterota bacterium M19]
MTIPSTINRNSQRQLRFFNIDLHISVIADIKLILEQLGHSVVDWSISGHTWVMGRKRADVKIVNQDTWQGLDQQMCDDFFNCYKDELSQYDAFIVTYSAAFALLYEKTNKPIILVNPTRYEHPFTDSPEKWRWLDSYLQKGIDEGRIIVIANNKGDEYYFRYFNGLPSLVIPSLCLYTKAEYTGKHPQFLLVTRMKSVLIPKQEMRLVRWLERLHEKWAAKLFANFSRRHGTILSSRQLHHHMVNKEETLKNGYSWQSLYDFKGIVHIPYQISTMSIFEQYSANVPLFFPSKRFLFELYQKNPDKVLSELSFYQVRNLDYSKLEKENPNNVAEESVIKRWIDLADYYDRDNMPYVQYFESFEHLESLLATVDCQKISSQMHKFNQTRKKGVFEQWQKLAEQIVSMLPS